MKKCLSCFRKSAPHSTECCQCGKATELEFIADIAPEPHILLDKLRNTPNLSRLDLFDLYKHDAIKVYLDDIDDEESGELSTAEIPITDEKDNEDLAATDELASNEEEFQTNEISNKSIEDEDYLDLTEAAIKETLEEEIQFLDSQVENLEKSTFAKSGILPLPEEQSSNESNAKPKAKSISFNIENETKTPYKILGLCSNTEPYPYLQFSQQKTSIFKTFFTIIFSLVIGFFIGILFMLFYGNHIMEIIYG
ncbi:MAG: hypothetical protein KBC30_01365 [Planctomycetes bacterium]|jgi:chemotaxis protein histidine kinase CheA|nr:hypothetical protein [Planctomycetota bacterium]